MWRSAVAQMVGPKIQFESVRRFAADPGSDDPGVGKQPVDPGKFGQFRRGPADRGKIRQVQAHEGNVGGGNPAPDGGKGAPGPFRIACGDDDAGAGGGQLFGSKVAEARVATGHDVGGSLPCCGAASKVMLLMELNATGGGWVFAAAAVGLSVRSMHDTAVERAAGAHSTDLEACRPY